MPSKPWQTKAWKDKRKSFLTRKVCEWCGATERLVIHHPTYLNPDGSSISSEQYLNWENTDIIILCRKCHTNYHKGKIRCKVCGEHWHDPKYESCWNCYSITPQGQATIERTSEEEYEDEIIEEINPLCGKKIEDYKWRFQLHIGIEGTCIVLCGKANECPIFNDWHNGKLKEEDTYNPQYFKEQREFEEKLQALIEQGVDEDEAIKQVLNDLK